MPQTEAPTVLLARKVEAIGESKAEVVLEDPGVASELERGDSLASIT
jgi:hypothetical protein